MAGNVLSAVVLAKNEEANIGRCLESVAFCDEIIVVDDGSTDKTTDIARQNNAVVYSRKINNDFASQRNFALQKAKGEWVLFVDADEQVSDGLAKEIKLLLEKKESKDKTAFYVKRRDFWMGKEMKYGETSKVRTRGIVRLIRKNSGRWAGNVHEVYFSEKEDRGLNSYLNHYPHPTIKNFLTDVNQYSTIRAKELRQNGKTTNIFEIIIYPLGKFILNYFLKLGILDGPEGFIYSLMMSFHSFLVRAKLYQYTHIDNKDANF